MNKTDNAYKSIGEVAKILNLVNKKNGTLNTHTIRFWEKEFKQIKPKIFTGKRRYYDKTSIDILKKNKKLKIAKFGTFSIRSKKKRIGRNPLTKENKEISDRNVVLFKASKEFKDLINITKNE